MQINHLLRRVYAIGQRSGDACWEWDRTRDGRGYGVVGMSIGGRVRQFKVHRLVLSLTKGLPDGAWACHTCDNPPCCNPDHLYAGSATDNNRDTVRRGRRNDPVHTHCKRGHPLSGDNLWPNYAGGRRCRECKRLDNKERMKKARAEGKPWALKR